MTTSNKIFQLPGMLEYLLGMLLLLLIQTFSVSYGGSLDRLSRNANTRFVSTHNSNNNYATQSIPGISCNFEEPCEWKWDEQKSETQPGFQISTGQDVINARSKLPDPIYEYSGPTTDADNNASGKF